MRGPTGTDRDTPWNSIVEGLVPSRERRLPLAAALTSPCEDCASTSCCTHLPLHSFAVTNLVEFDHARYLLNFDRIVLGIAANGTWSVYYTQPCRHLDRETFACTVHNTPEQPSICATYNPYACWYRKVLTVSVHDEFVRVDRARLDVLGRHIEFDEDRSITSVPAWDDLKELLRDVHDEPAPPTAPAPATVLDQWASDVRAGTSLPVVAPRVGAAGDRDPCDGCAAYCCDTLVFPKRAPSTAANVDWFRFCLGFDGVEVGISHGSWSLVVRTRCRHLDADQRCGVYGTPERPLICTFYDATACQYVPQFATAPSHDFLRVRLDDFAVVEESITVDEHGNVHTLPTPADLRGRIEAAWRAHG